MRRHWHQPLKPFLILPFLSMIIGIGLLAAVDSAQAQGFEASPFQLVNLAYEGYLSEAGIPSRRQLEHRYSDHEIDAEDLIEAGIATGYLPESRREDSVFENAVRVQMRSLRHQRPND